MPSHESEMLEDKQKLQIKTFSELAECLAWIAPKNSVLQNWSELAFVFSFSVKFGPTCLLLFCSHHPLVKLLMFWKPTKSSGFVEDMRIPFDCKQQISTKHSKLKTSHVIVFKKTSIQSYFSWNPC